MADWKDSFNWLLVLGLDFDPPPIDAKVIEDAYAAQSKIVGLNNNLNDSKSGNQYRAINDHMGKKENGEPAIVKLLKDQERREKCAEDARVIVYKKLDKMLRTAAENEGAADDVESHKFAKIARLTQKRVQDETRIPYWECSEALVRKRAVDLGLIIIETGSAETSTSQKEEIDAYEPFSKRKRWSAKGWDKLDDALGHFHCGTLYEYACPVGYTGDPALAPLSALVDRAVERKNAFKQHNTDKSAAETIAAEASSIFKDEVARAEYDEYLEFCAVNRALDGFMAIVEVSGDTVDKGTFDDAVKSVASALKGEGKTKAPLIVSGFCRKKGIKPPLQSNTRYCSRCSHANPFSSSVCQGCGLPLVVECASCGKKIATSEKYCTCGAPIGTVIDEVSVLCSDAMRSVARFDFASADASLKQARAKWPNLRRYDEIEQKISSARNAVGPIADKLAKLMAEKRYVAANEAYAQARRQHAGFSAYSIEREIAEHIAEADDLAKRAAASAAEGDKVDLYERALAICADHRDALSFMRGNPPAAPTDFHASVDAAAGIVRLTWSASVSKGAVTYAVRRCEGSAPVDPDDGDGISSGNVVRAEDSSARPGRPYYYAVFAIRGGASSKAAKLAAPIYLTSEVANLTVSPGDGVVEFHWKALDAGEVEIVEASPERCTVARTSGSYATHSGLVNGSTYSYRVRVVYRIDGKEVGTDGIAVSATPIGAEDSIVDFRSVRDRSSEGLFSLTWTERPRTKVSLFCTSDRDKVPEVDTVCSLDEIERAFDLVATRNQKPGSATLQYSGDAPLLVFPVTIYGKTAVVGNYVRVFAKEEIRITDVRRMNDEVVIRIAPPEKAIGFIVLCRSDRFVRDVGENSKGGDQERHQVLLRTYERDGALRIKYAGERDYYISVGAMYGTPGSPSYSELTEHLFSTKPKASVTYSIRALKMPFVGVKATLTFSSATPWFRLPETVVEYGIGGLPVFSGSGTQLAVIPAQDVEGSLDFEVSGLPNRKGIYLKASPSDSAAEAYVLDSRSNCKIS